MFLTNEWHNHQFKYHIELFFSFDIQFMNFKTKKICININTIRTQKFLRSKKFPHTNQLSSHPLPTHIIPGKQCSVVHHHSCVFNIVM